MRFRNWKETDCGASVGDRNDCTVRAFMKAMGCDYQTARANLAAFGRKPNKGIRWTQFVKWYNGRSYEGRTLRELDLAKTADKWKHPSRQRCTEFKTVGQFAAAHPVGRYVLRVPGHVIPLIDGVVYDWKDSKRRHLLGVTEAVACDRVAPQKPKPVDTKPTIYAVQQAFSF